MQEYNAQGKVIRSTDLAGRVTTTAWDCCHKISETKPDGQTTTWDYDTEGRMIASSRLIPLDATNVTWVTTCYRYDAMGRQTATWTTNYTEHVGTPATTTSYDALGRVIARTDVLGNATTMTYSPDGRTVSVRKPNGATAITTRNSNGDTLSITGTGVTPEFMSRGVLADGTRWTKTVQGETADSPRFAKSYENLLGQSVRSEKSGFRGAVLASVNTYDGYGRLVSTASDGEPTSEITYDALGNRVATVTRVASGEWRKSESYSGYALRGSDIWAVQTNVVSCSDATIAPQSQSRASRVTGLTPALVSESLTTDARGNTSESRVEFDGFESIGIGINPAQTGRAESHSRLGVAVRSVSATGVETRSLYDGLGRVCTSIDGRGNATITEYDSFGRQSATIDADNNRTTYGYDALGQLVSVTNPLGDAVTYAYDLRGHKTYEGGATYPVRRYYDCFNALTNATSYLSEAGGEGQILSFVYDRCSGAITKIIYPDGSCVAYAYNEAGRLVEKSLARGVVVTYRHDEWNNVTNILYSDSTPSVSVSYDAMGRPRSARDASGVSGYFYDIDGVCTNEKTSVSTIIRNRDMFGRSAGYRHSFGIVTSNVYDGVSGRLSEASFGGAVFHYEYLTGSDLEEIVDGPSLKKVLKYQDKSDRISDISYYGVDRISSRTYCYGLSGEIVSREQYRKGSPIRYDLFSNDFRGQLTNAVIGAAVYSYQYDDSGNRIRANESGVDKAYQVNELNQYDDVDDGSFGRSRLAYDEDGNQILVRTSTGIWDVEYNGDNRPVKWSCGSTNILFTYDWMGRCVRRLVCENGKVNSESLYCYNGSLRIVECIVSGGQTSVVSRIFWDPLHSAATRPLAMMQGDCIYYYATDITKNVCELIDANGNIVQTYDYSPFGIVIAESGCLRNGICWSSEFCDRELNVCTYLSRFYEPANGRWLSRDVLEKEGANLYSYVDNQPIQKVDVLGYSISEAECNERVQTEKTSERAKKLFEEIKSDGQCVVPEITCGCCQNPRQGGNFDPRSKNVTICINNISGAGYVPDIVIHELVHAYDNCKGTDWNDCKKRACSEIRATKLSGECQIGAVKRRFITIFGHGYYEDEETCIKRSARDSLGETICQPSKDYVNASYGECANNNSPL